MVSLTESEENHKQQALAPCLKPLTLPVAAADPVG
jgi:hypothetical protein